MRADDPAVADGRRSRLTVPLAVLPHLPSPPLDVRDMDSLVRIARRYDAVILHHAGPQGECFLVIDGEAVFRFARPAPGWKLAIDDGAPPHAEAARADPEGSPTHLAVRRSASGRPPRRRHLRALPPVLRPAPRPPRR